MKALTRQICGNSWIAAPSSCVTFAFTVPAGCTENELLIAAYDATTASASVLDDTNPALGFLGGAYSGPAGGGEVEFSFTAPASGEYQLVIAAINGDQFSTGCSSLGNFHQIHAGVCFDSTVAQISNGEEVDNDACASRTLQVQGSSAQNPTEQTGDNPGAGEIGGTLVDGPTTCTGSVNTLNLATGWTGLTTPTPTSYQYRPAVTNFPITQGTLFFHTPLYTNVDICVSIHIQRTAPLGECPPGEMSLGFYSTTPPSGQLLTEARAAFNPADPTLNYLGGSGPIVDDFVTFAFFVPANTYYHPFVFRQNDSLDVQTCSLFTTFGFEPVGGASTLSCRLPSFLP